MPAEIQFTQEIQDKICDLLADMPMSKICKLDGMPSNSTVLKWYRQHPEFHEACRRARDICADNEVERHKELIDNVIDGTLSPDAARIALNAVQWRIIQLDKARYGDTAKPTTVNNYTDNRRVDVTFEEMKLLPPEHLKAAKQLIKSKLEPITITATNDGEDGLTGK